MMESPEKDFTTVTITMRKVLKKNGSIMSTGEDIKVTVYKNRTPITENTVSEKFTGWS